MTDKVPGIRISLWTVKSDNDKAPKFNGYVNIDGVDHPVSVWDNSNAEHPKAPALKGKNSRPSPKLTSPPTFQETGEPLSIGKIVSNIPLPF